MNDKRRGQTRRLSSRSLTSLCGLGVEDHAHIDHLLWVNDQGYRSRVTGYVAALSSCHEMVQVDFHCRESCCVEWSPERTEEYLRFHVWMHTSRLVA
jgi:hypothetical protein